MKIENEALIVIDMQNDFCNGGSLAVPLANDILGAINKLMNGFDTVIFTQDWHPQNHSSFASQHPKLDDYSVVEMSYGEQILWPDHCVQGSKGAEFNCDLNINKAQLIVRKGFNRGIDSYSAFYENDRVTSTGLCGFLKEKEIKKIILVGLALDFCVKFTALDGISLGFKVEVIKSLCRGINIDNSLQVALDDMTREGVYISG
ncbi:MAG: bifunctional nicotinamidase/pyrazinamidase [Proteobacteria bacterium]|jgi:nicotinamidase/pyrazinamidase|nr:bifunctional nicotinamidase/pyrazinamidase [Pseudomonadota bacterium]